MVTNKYLEIAVGAVIPVNEGNYRFSQMLHFLVSHLQNIMMVFRNVVMLCVI